MLATTMLWSLARRLAGWTSAGGRVAACKSAGAAPPATSKIRPAVGLGVSLAFFTRKTPSSPPLKLVATAVDEPNPSLMLSVIQKPCPDADSVVMSRLRGEMGGGGAALIPGLPANIWPTTGAAVPDVVEPEAVGEVSVDINEPASVVVETDIVPA